MDIATFLLARLAEDKAVATVAATTSFGQPVPWWPYERPSAYGVWAAPAARAAGRRVAYVSTTEEQAHITRWDPARVLAECAAKRRIVEAEPERWVPQPDAPGATVDMGCPEGMVRVYGKLISELEYRDRYMQLAPPSQTLLFLAIPYRAHPEYRPEWAEPVAAV